MSNNTFKKLKLLNSNCKSKKCQNKILLKNKSKFLPIDEESKNSYEIM